MKITFLGTGAADFSPLLQTEYKDKLGRDVRRSSSILIEEQYLVDCGPHVLDSFRIQNLDCCKVTDLFVTHFHADHYNWECAAQLAAKTELPLRIWHHAGAKPDPVPNAVFCPLEPGEEQQNGTLKVKPLAANHSGWPLHYDFELDGQRMFYGCDGAWVLNDTFAAMRNRKYHCMILDGTVGDYTGDIRVAEHNSIPMIRLLLASYRKYKVIAPEGLVYLSHIAPTLHAPHVETEKLLDKDEILLAYDGLTIYTSNKE